MTAKNKLEILPLPREHDPVAMDAFHEDRIRQDLARFSKLPGMLEKYIERLRIRFQKANERAVIDEWTELFRRTESLLAAKNAVERQKAEYLKLGREHQTGEGESSATLAKHQADTEEHLLRRDIAVYKRQNLERFVEGGQQQPPATSEPKLTAEQQRLLKKAEIEAQLNRLKFDETVAVAQADGELEKRRLQNIYANRREQLMEQLEKYL